MNNVKVFFNRIIKSCAKKLIFFVQNMYIEEQRRCYGHQRKSLMFLMVNTD